MLKTFSVDLLLKPLNMLFNASDSLQNGLGMLMWWVSVFEAIHLDLYQEVKIMVFVLQVVNDAPGYDF